MGRNTFFTLLVSAALSIAVLATEREAVADTVKARNATSVYADQGEKAKVVTRVRAGQTMTVLRRDGRWIKVRVNGLSGWITRSQADTRAAMSATTPQRKVSFVEGRSRRDGAESAPEDRVGGDAVKQDSEENFDEDLADEPEAAEPEPAEDDSDEDAEREKRKKAKADAAKAEQAKAEKARRVAARERKAKKQSRKRSKADSGDDEEDFDDEEETGDDEEDSEESSSDEEAEEEESSESKDSGRDETVVVVADETELFSKPSSRSKSVDFASEGQRLSVIERDGDWILVETSDGEEGWVRAKDVGTSGYQYKKLSINAVAGLAYRKIGQSFTSNSSDPLGNYNVGSGAAMLDIGGDLLYDYSPTYLLGGDLDIGYTRASPGVRFVDPDTDMPADIGFNMLQVNVGGRAGYKISKSTGMAAFARLGYRYERFSVNNVTDFDEANTARLPSEILQGLTVGAILDVPLIAKKYSARIGFDYLSTSTLGKRSQTTGLEDGDSSRVRGIWGNARVLYQWRDNMQLGGTYEYARADTEWVGRPEDSQRRHILNDTAANEAVRKDITHTVMLGLTRAF